jgi:uncharacterized membrane protein
MTDPTPAPPRRLDGVDCLRGLVMVLMALDHARDFYYPRSEPTDLTTAEPLLFFTRWITHYCAPTFILLAGVGASLSRQRGKAVPELAWFLLTRGLWLIVLELTLVRWGWTFSLDYTVLWVQVFWALGWGMIVLAGLIWLPTSMIVGFGAALIVFHNLFDRFTAADAGETWGWLWAVLHVPTELQRWDGGKFLPGYPLIPWVGVMAVGYGVGELYRLEPRRRRVELLGLGLTLTVLFVALRLTNLYGDPRPWEFQERGPALTACSFLNCHKYPPSLLYLLMTLGPAIVFLGVAEGGATGPLDRFVTVFGRVPLFYYLLHMPLIQFTAGVCLYLKYGDVIWTYRPGGGGEMPPDFGFGLTGTYVAWVLVVLALYPVCHWFAGVKRRHPGGWLSYL